MRADTPKQTTAPFALACFDKNDNYVKKYSDRVICVVILLTFYQLYYKII